MRSNNNQEFELKDYDLDFKCSLIEQWKNGTDKNSLASLVCSYAKSKKLKLTKSKAKEHIDKILLENYSKSI